MNKILSRKYFPVILFLLLATELFSAAFKRPAHNTFTGEKTDIDTGQNRFTKVVLAQKLEEPMHFEILKDGRVLFAERKGKLKLYNSATGKVTGLHKYL